LDLLDRIKGILTADELARFAFKPEPPLPQPQPPGVRKIATGLTHEYSTMYPGDPLHRALLLQHPGGFYGLHSAIDGGRITMLPAEINHSSQPRWRRSKPDCFLYLWASEIREYDIGTGQITTLKKFDLARIDGMGESDLSEDDDHIVLCAGRTVFVYEFNTDRILNHYAAPEAFNNLYLSPDNRALIGFNEAIQRDGDNKGRGIKIVNSSEDVGPVAAALGHMDVSSDRNGNPIAVWCNSADSSGKDKHAEKPDCENAIVKINLDTGFQDCLLSLDWSLAVHISLPDKATFALVSTYDPLDPESTVQYANENLIVELDGSGVRSLGKHGADSRSYAGKPKASVSPDGTRYVYDSRGDVFLGTIS
jgi:hypothetical protein